MVLTLREIALFSLVLILGSLFVGSIVFGWTNPSANPPSNNVAAPLNAGGGAQTKSGNLSVNQLTATVAEGTAPLVVTSQTKVANLNADLLDGLDSSGFGDATLSNQSSILAKIGSSTDAGSLTPSTLFAGIKGIIAQVDSAYATTITLIGLGSAPSCPGGWTEIVSQTAAGSFVSNTSGPGSYAVTPANSTYHSSYQASQTVVNAAAHGYTTYTFYYRVCGLQR